jgi:PIN domain nuclease of toxin-antitoxin system
MKVLLDTCALIYLFEGQAIAKQASEAVFAAASRGTLFLSPISWWEIGLLTQPDRKKLTLDLKPDPVTFLARAQAAQGVSVCDLSLEMLFGASHLPRPIHPDPADRLFIATARNLDATLITDDKRILAYAKAGHVKAIAC